MVKTKRSQFIGVLAALSLITVSSCDKSEPVDRASNAISFVQAMNLNDVDKAINLTSHSLNIRNQEWESASDGIGFVLGKTEEISLDGREKIKVWFTENIKKIGVESNKPSKVKLGLLKNELKGMEKAWAGVDIYLFLRGMGGVEHIFVVGIDSKGKVATLYIN